MNLRRTVKTTGRNSVIACRSYRTEQVSSVNARLKTHTIGRHTFCLTRKANTVRRINAKTPLSNWIFLRNSSRSSSSRTLADHADISEGADRSAPLSRQKGSPPVGEQNARNSSGGRYSIAEARSNLPTIVNEAEAGLEIELTRRGKPVAVVVSPRQLGRLRVGRPRFSDVYKAFLSKHSLEDIDLENDFFRFVREKSVGRKVSL